ncbi:hypothetical protein GGR20_003677 [Devosia subaequoris]|uniref:Aldose 1-epimerase n=1 Tax=Devosia subaequoris TaxID=395930 RepID=A0A7W6IQJ2_9HYPH|nr:hypothetical protein [Devosia subaequoris]MBB4054005.1 hypothetical protein [Devosia subaequoris]MCP1211522.1 aldose 1-epimerase family protein [Devosia subaequoris]
MPGDAGNSRALVWSHGSFAVEALGGMIGKGAFLMADGKQVSPFFVAPWWDEDGLESYDGLTRGLRGEWPCVPFGYPMPRESFTSRWQTVMDDADNHSDVHGYGSNHDWDFAEQGDPSLVSMSIDYPEDHDVARLRRTLRGMPGEARIALELEITARRPCRTPVALHGCFALPQGVGGAELAVGQFGGGLTFPGVIEPGAALFAKDHEFTDLQSVPTLDGGVVNAANLPLAGSAEELLQLNGVDGTVDLINRVQGYRMSLSWDSTLLPSLVLWYSNRGRRGAPWLGRTLCIGIEPSATTFGLSPRTSAQDNPIADGGTSTALDLAPDTPVTIQYSVAVAPLPLTAAPPRRDLR